MMSLSTRRNGKNGNSAPPFLSRSHSSKKAAKGSSGKRDCSERKRKKGKKHRRGWELKEIVVLLPWVMRPVTPLVWRRGEVCRRALPWRSASGAGGGSTSRGPQHAGCSGASHVGWTPSLCAVRSYCSGGGNPFETEEELSMTEVGKQEAGGAVENPFDAESPQTDTNPFDAKPQTDTNSFEAEQQILETASATNPFEMDATEPQVAPASAQQSMSEPAENPFEADAGVFDPPTPSNSGGDAANPFEAEAAPAETTSAPQGPAVVDSSAYGKKLDMVVAELRKLKYETHVTRTSSQPVTATIQAKSLFGEQWQVSATGQTANEAMQAVAEAVLSGGRNVNVVTKTRPIIRTKFPRGVFSYFLECAARATRKGQAGASGAVSSNGGFSFTVKTSVPSILSNQVQYHISGTAGGVTKPVERSGRTNLSESTRGILSELLFVAGNVILRSNLPNQYRSIVKEAIKSIDVDINTSTNVGRLFTSLVKAYFGTLADVDVSATTIGDGLAAASVTLVLPLQPETGSTCKFLLCTAVAETEERAVQAVLFRALKENFSEYCPQLRDRYYEAEDDCLKYAATITAYATAEPQKFLTGVYKEHHDPKQRGTITVVAKQIGGKDGKFSAEVRANNVVIAKASGLNEDMARLRALWIAIGNAAREMRLPIEVDGVQNELTPSKPIVVPWGKDFVAMVRQVTTAKESTPSDGHGAVYLGIGDSEKKASRSVQLNFDRRVTMPKKSYKETKGKGGASLAVLEHSALLRTVLWEVASRASLRIKSSTTGSGRSRLFKVEVTAKMNLSSKQAKKSRDKPEETTVSNTYSSWLEAIYWSLANACSSLGINSSTVERITEADLRDQQARLLSSSRGESQNLAHEELIMSTPPPPRAGGATCLLAYLRRAVLLEAETSVEAGTHNFDLPFRESVRYMEAKNLCTTTISDSKGNVIVERTGDVTLLLGLRLSAYADLSRKMGGSPSALMQKAIAALGNVPPIDKTAVLQSVPSMIKYLYGMGTTAVVQYDTTEDQYWCTIAAIPPAEARKSAGTDPAAPIVVGRVRGESRETAIENCAEWVIHGCAGSVLARKPQITTVRPQGISAVTRLLSVALGPKVAVECSICSYPPLSSNATIAVSSVSITTATEILFSVPQTAAPMRDLVLGARAVASKHGVHVSTVDTFLKMEAPNTTPDLLARAVVRVAFGAELISRVQTRSAELQHVVHLFLRNGTTRLPTRLFSYAHKDKNDALQLASLWFVRENFPNVYEQAEGKHWAASTTDVSNPGSSSTYEIESASFRLESALQHAFSSVGSRLRMTEEQSGGIWLVRFHEQPLTSSEVGASEHRELDLTTERLVLTVKGSERTKAKVQGMWKLLTKFPTKIKELMAKYPKVVETARSLAQSA